MPRFVARPITVEAVQFNGDIAPWPEPFRRAVLRHLPGGITEIRTDDGTRPCKVRDWVLHGPGGFQVVREAVFEAMFEAKGPPDDPVAPVEPAARPAEPGMPPVEPEDLSPPAKRPARK